MRNNWMRLMTLVLILAMTCSAGASAQTQRTEIRLWHMLSGVAEEAFRKIVDDYNASQDLYTVVAEYQGNWYDSFSKFKATSRDDMPDLYQIVVECMYYMVDSNLIVPVQQLIEADSEFDMEDIVPSLRAMYSSGDVLYSLPLSVTMFALSYNTQALEKAGIDPATLTTIEAVDAAAKQIVDQGICKYGWSLLNDSWQIEEFMVSSGDYTFDHQNGRDGVVTRCLMGESEEARKIFDLMYACLSRDYNLAPSSGQSTNDVTSAFCNGELAMMIGSSQWVLKNRESITDFTLSQLAAPYYTQASSGVYSPGGNSVYVIDKGDEQRKAGAWDFLKYLYQSEVSGFYASYTGYAPATYSAYDSEVYKAWRESYPFVENIWDSLMTCDTEHLTALCGVYYEFRQTVQNAFARMFDDPNFGPGEAIETIVRDTDVNIELYNEANS